MPELPELEIYRLRLTRFLVDQRVVGLRVAQSFVLRTVDPPIEPLVGGEAVAVIRRGKRLVLRFDGDDGHGDPSSPCTADAGNLVRVAVPPSLG